MQLEYIAMKRARLGFSAIELIVIVIAALLLTAILLPAVARLREGSHDDASVGSLHIQNQSSTGSFPAIG